MNKHNEKWCMTEPRVFSCFMQRKESPLLLVGLFSLLRAWVKWICPALVCSVDLHLMFHQTLSVHIKFLFQIPSQFFSEKSPNNIQY